MPPLRARWLLVALAADLVTAAGFTGCSTPNSQERACAAKASMEAAANQVRAFDYRNPDAANLASRLDAMAKELTPAEAAVPLRQNPRLRDLGGVSHLRQLRREIDGTARQLRHADLAAETIVVFQLRATVTAQAAQVQGVADAINGC